MEKISIELNLLEKTFPFIKFSFAQPHECVRIHINNTLINKNYRFWYDSEDPQWRIQGIAISLQFNEFLDKFIFGLIRWCLY